MKHILFKNYLSIIYIKENLIFEPTFITICKYDRHLFIT